MTANRPRRPGSRGDIGMLEVLFYGVPAPNPARHARVWVPPTDVYETEDLVVVQVEIPGVKQSDISVTLYNRLLVVAGRRADGGPTRRAYHQMEINYGEFRAEVELPMAVDEHNVDAEYSDGFLRIALPKVQNR